MSSIPRNRYAEAKFLGGFFQEVPIVAAVPVPARQDFFPGQVAKVKRLLPCDIWDEIDCQPESMRALEYPRFRSAFFEEVSLPDRVAVRLEDFEAGLRSAGFVGPDQSLVQSSYDGAKFRVKQTRVVVDGHDDFTPLRERRRKRARF